MALLHTPVAELGWQAPNFSLADPSGETYQLEDALVEKGAVVAFICNHCPYVVAVADQIAADGNRLQEQGIGFIAVMPNNYQYVQADSPENMVLFAEKYGFTFPYVVDEDQSIAKTFGAVCTPDFFGLNAKGELQYRGRIDDSALVDAMLAIAETGLGPKEQRPSKGCSIKWR